MARSVNPSEGHKFVALDAFRGIAAILVVNFHLKAVAYPTLFPHAYLAVDFFFMLSGFVLSYAYQRRLDAGIPTREFLKLRLARLYPLYALGLVVSVLFRLAQNAGRSGNNHLPVSVLVPAFLTSLLLIPAPFQLPGLFPSTFPFDPPSWSLFNEIVVNGLHALFGRRRSTRFFVLVALAAGAATALFAQQHGSMDFGVNRLEILQGMTRTIFGYTLGILLFRLWSSGRLQFKSSALIPASLLLVALMPHVGAHWNALYDMAVTTLVLPLILVLGAVSATPKALAPWFEKLGLASYAIYMLHFPAFGFFGQIWTHLVGRGSGFYAPWSGLLFILMLVAACVAIDRVYDLPARAWLRRLLSGGNRGIAS